jgi:integrase
MASYRPRVRKDGSTTFQVTWREGGKQLGHTVDTESEAKMWVRLIEQTGSFGAAAAAHKAVRDGEYTLSRAVEDHIGLLLKPTPQTLHSYRSMLANHIMDSIGAVPVADLSPKILADWVRAMQKKELSAKTIRNVHGLISSAIDRCIPAHLSHNPCKGVDLPDSEAEGDHVCFLTYGEFLKIHGALPEHYKPFALFLVVTGARFGEATALTVEDLQLKHRKGHPATVRINKAWKRNGSSGWYVGPPKSATSKRTVSLSDPLADALRPLIDGRAPIDLVFVNERGGRITQPVFYGAWTRTINKIRFVDDTFTKTPRVHDLRHTSASWLIQEGYDLFKVARRLGHADTNMVDKVYGHLMPEGMVEGARRIEDAMRPRELEQPDEDDEETP